MANLVNRGVVKAHPRIAKPDSVTHLLCSAGIGASTHHLRQRSASGGEMVCSGCKQTESALRAQAVQAGVLK